MRLPSCEGDALAVETVLGILRLALPQPSPVRGDGFVVLDSGGHVITRVTTHTLQSTGKSVFNIA